MPFHVILVLFDCTGNEDVLIVTSVLGYSMSYCTIFRVYVTFLLSL